MFLARETYTNICIGFTGGFFKYAHIVLFQANGPTYVPFLHSNQSSREAFFALLHCMNKDTAVKFTSMASCLDVNNAQDCLKNNPMYLMEHIKKGKSAATDQLELITNRTDKKQKERAGRLWKNCLEDQSHK